MQNHPSTRIFSSYSNRLEGKTILLGITGSVASFLSPKIARELIRHGAKVIPVMSEDGAKMIGKDLMWWATGQEPITKITGRLEHIALAGVMNNPVDLMLIAPCTTNTVAKLHSGIADTPVTLIASSLNGKNIPISILCVAHEDLINSPPIQEGIEKLKTWGIHSIDPVLEEGKAKAPSVEDIMFEVFILLTPKKLRDRTVIITGGPTREYIDNVRYITNSSSGRTGIEFAKEAYLSGANVSLVLGPTHLPVPRNIPTSTVETSEEMYEKVISLLKQTPDAIVILSAAMADFKPKNINIGKIKSGNDLNIHLIPTVKLSDHIKNEYPNSTLVLFKAEWDVGIDVLKERAIEKLNKCKGDLIIANDLSQPGAGFQTITNSVLIIDSNHNAVDLTSTKNQLAQVIIDKIS